MKCDITFEKIKMQAGNEKTITNGLKLENLKVKNKEQKFRINLAMIIVFYTASFTLSFAISVLIGYNVWSVC